MDNLRSHFLPLLVLVLVVMFFQGPLIGMYFRLDDYSILYLVQQHQPLTFPYQYLYFLAKPIYQIFGTEPKAYFVLSIVLYLSANLLLYSLIYLWLRKKVIALLSVLIFSVGLIGQDAMLMFLGDGLVTVTGLNILLLLLICLTKFYDSHQRSWLISAVILFFAILEIAPIRYAGVILVVMGADLLSIIRKGRKLDKNFIYRNIIFMLVFLVQYLFHPSHYLLNYSLAGDRPYDFSTSIDKINIFASFKPQYLTNPIGTFGNLFYPTFLQNNFHFLLERLPSKFANQSFWLSSIPALIFALLMFYLSLSLRYQRSLKLKYLLLISGFLIFYLLWGNLILKIVEDNFDKLYTLTGGIFLATLVWLYLAEMPASSYYSLLSIVITFGLLSIFVLSKPDVLLVSTHRYLISVAFVPSIIMLFFVSKELDEKKSSKRNIAIAFFAIPFLAILLSFVFAESNINQKVKFNYSQYARKFYLELKSYLPQITEKTVIYLEGGTKDFNYILGDITRGGYVPSSAVLAVHYRTDMNNIILPDKTADIPAILKENPTISLNNIYSFIYTPNGLQDTSKNLRGLLKGNHQPYYLDATSWQVQPAESIFHQDTQLVIVGTTYFKQSTDTLGVYPTLILKTTTPKVNTQLPLEVTLRIKAILAEVLPRPYYHLFNRPEGAEQSLWPEILSWEKNQCQKGELSGEFECVGNQDARRVLMERSGEIEIQWGYNYYGSVAEDKSKKIKVWLDGLWHDYKFIIPAGGEYLDKLTIKYISFPGTMVLGKTKLSYGDSLQ